MAFNPPKFDKFNKEPKDELDQAKKFDLNQTASVKSKGDGVTITATGKVKDGSGSTKIQAEFDISKLGKFTGEVDSNQLFSGKVESKTLVPGCEFTLERKYDRESIDKTKKNKDVKVDKVITTGTVSYGRNNITVNGETKVEEYSGNRKIGFCANGSVGSDGISVGGQLKFDLEKLKDVSLGLNYAAGSSVYHLTSENKFKTANFGFHRKVSDKVQFMGLFSFDTSLEERDDGTSVARDFYTAGKSFEFGMFHTLSSTSDVRLKLTRECCGSYKLHSVYSEKIRESMKLSLGSCFDIANIQTAAPTFGIKLELGDL
jgi:hypothetical protein